MSQRNPVAVITVTYNSADVIADFLRALKGASAQPIDLVVVDNCSTDDTLSIVATLAGDATVVKSDRNGGFAAGINLGLDVVDCDRSVLVINPDVRLCPDSLDRLVATTSDPAVGIVVPQLRDDSGALLYSLRRDPRAFRILSEACLGGVRAGRLGLGEMVVARRRYRSAGRADWATGACMLITPECRHKTGRWDESFFLYSEETDYAVRARDAGFSLMYQPSAKAIHRGGDAHRSPALFTLLMLNRWRFYRRRHGRIASLFFRAALVVDLLPRAIMGRPTARAALSSMTSRRTNPDVATLVEQT